MGRKTQRMREVAVFVPVEENQPVESLRAKLAEITKRKDVLGSILRDSASAVIDLRDSAKIVEYAILSSQALDSGKDLSGLFNLGVTESIVIKGNDIKALCMVVGENKIAVFMEKDADHSDIVRQFSPFQNQTTQMFVVSNPDV
jgi:predicted regulator of Ras-like GTPase activity (Roadblock/LC7/MglB family)